MATNYLPAGVSSVSPYLIITDVNEVLEFLKTVLNAVVQDSMIGKDGSMNHASVRIGDSTIMMGKGAEPLQAMVHVYLPDVDAAYAKALLQGATSIMEPSDQFYGDRSCGVKGPQGNQWWFATHIEDVSSEELQRRATEQGK